MPGLGGLDILEVVASGPAADGVHDGALALERAEWEAAREAFTSALARESSPQAHDGLGQALYFLGQVFEGIAERERAFEGYVAIGRCDEAARAATWVSHQYLLAGRASAARGWLARAERCLEGSAASCLGRGWLAVEVARQAGSTDVQVEQAGRAMQIARSRGNADLEVLALSVLGRAVLSAGRREEGLLLLEEAMAAASSGRGSNVHVLAEAYCNLIEGCAIAGEWERGAEWCELVDEFAQAAGATPLVGACRAIHADVLLATGRWAQAEQALETARVTHARFIPQMDGPAVATLAELRVQQGRLRDAELLLAGRGDQPESLRALALLRLAEDRPGEAAALLVQGLRGVAGHAVRAAQLLAPLVDARLDCGDLAGAARAASDLSEIAGQADIRLVRALSDLATARVALATGRAFEAVEPARRAGAAFRRLEMPYAEGNARLALARALARPELALALDEARTALATFRELGAARAADVAAGLVRDLGGATGPRTRVPGQLTAREQEVLELVALGMSNARIATTLVISDKTAGHHVSRILAKLGVHNRTEAAAHARRAPTSVR